MARRRTKRDNRNGGRFAAGQDHEIKRFADRNGITIGQARGLAKVFGIHQEKLERGVAKTKD